MLSEYVVNDRTYKAYAYNICGCNNLKNDLVNDMYIKLYNLLQKEPERKISNGFIYSIMRNSFLTGIRNNKEILVDDFPETETDNDSLCERISMDNVLSEISFFDREILLKAQEKSFRKIGVDIDCHHSTVSKMYNKSLEKVKIKCQEKGMQIVRTKAK